MYIKGFSMKIRVYYEDTDTGGVVYHSNYLNFCERARSEAFFSRGLNPVLETGHFVARRVSGEFYLSAKLGDLIEVKTRMIEMKSASFSLKQTIFRDDEKIFELDILLAYISFDSKPKRIEKETKNLLVSIFS